MPETRGVAPEGVEHEAATETTNAQGLRGVFGDGAPDVAITGVTVARSTITQPQKAAEQRHLNWTISGALVDDQAELLLFGDLTAHEANWFVGTTAVAMIQFRDKDHRIEPDDLKRYVNTLGGWASHVLYDAAASTARALVANTSDCPIKIPSSTPMPKFRVVDDEASDPRSDESST